MLVNLTYYLMVDRANYYIIKEGLLLLCSQALQLMERWFTYERRPFNWATLFF